ncbi:NAD-dependent epimerase/dehydratase family protein [Streptomyces sp. NPDC059063]|uniref:NAD-dependent epimerase/dehydratase family protein n=1 Tax=unclassified Streptomyces TaxID=2593676 RepID=UPI00367F11E5
MDGAEAAERPAAVVLGAGGFIGRTVCAALRAAGWPVAAVGRRAVHPPAGCRAVRLDVARTDPKTLTAELAALRPGLVVNAAGALWDVTDDELTEGNVTLVERLLDAVAAQPRPVRLVHIGSAYEYGPHPGKRLVESLPARPVGRYAQTKLAGTRLVTRAVADGRVDATVLRIAVSVGPFAPRHSLLGGITRQLAAHPDVLRLPPIDGVRDVIDVRDVADAVLCAARADRPPPVVNIGSGVGVRLTDLVEELIRIAGPRAAGARVVPAAPPAVRRDTGVGSQPLDIGLAHRAFGWSPARTALDALQALWDSARAASGGGTPPVPTSAANEESIHG